MKYVKMLGLTAVAAMALMAFAGTASASVVCSTNITSNCFNTAWAVPNGTVFDFSLEAGTSAILEDTSGFIRNKCTESTLKASLDNGDATATANLTVTELKWGSATTPCSNPTANVKLGHLEIHAVTGKDQGTVTATGFEVTNEIAGLDCIYESGTGLDLGLINEGSTALNPPKLNINVVVNRTPASPMNCPPTARWTATYVLTSPANTTLNIAAS